MDSLPLGGGAPAEVHAWHHHFADALASRDIDRYLAFLHDDCMLQVNNAVPIYSKRAIRGAYALYLQMFRTLSFEHLTLIGDAAHSVGETLFTYGCNDGSTEVIQCAYVVDRDDAGLVISVRVYGNGSRVFKPFMRAND